MTLNKTAHLPPVSGDDAKFKQIGHEKNHNKCRDESRGHRGKCSGARCEKYGKSDEKRFRHHQVPTEKERMDALPPDEPTLYFRKRLPTGQSYACEVCQHNVSSLTS